MGRYRTLGLFLLLSAIWGSAFAAIKAGLAFFPPVLFAAIRYDIAGLLMLGYAAYVVDHPVPRDWREWAAVGVGATLVIAAYHALLFIGETDPAVTSAAAAVVVSLNPILTTGFSRVLLPDERLTLVGIVGLLLGLVGVIVLANPDPGNVLGGGTIAKLLVFGAVASFALGSVLTRRIESGLAIETLEGWSMAGGAVLMHVIAYGRGERVVAIAWTAEAVLSLTYLALAASALGFLLYFVLLERLGAVETNLLSYVAPVFAALTGWFLLGETPTAATVAGFLLILLGFLLLKRHSIREELALIEGRFLP